MTATPHARGADPGRPGRQDRGPAVLRAAGPLGQPVHTDGSTVKADVGWQFGADANALILLHRVAFPGDDGAVDKAGQRALLHWAAEHQLGQDPSLVADVAERRARALAAMALAGYTAARLAAVPEWRLAVGLGNRANAHEIGLALHGTYGWPVIPGSTIKGMIAAFAQQAGAGPHNLGRVFGMPRLRGGPDPQAETGQEPPRSRRSASCGTVTFLDAIPLGEPVRVVRDVLTPHVKPYYDDIARNERRPAAPAEHHQPVPVEFLTIAGGAYAVDLVGRDADDVDQAAEWCQAAFDDSGIGAKTSSGYGYVTASRCGQGSSP
jgi:CRISPR-associated protein Cmr6